MSAVAHEIRVVHPTDQIVVLSCGVPGCGHRELCGAVPPPAPRLCPGHGTALYARLYAPVAS